MTIDLLAVVVPAHNEAELIGRCLRHLLAASDRLGTLVPSPAIRIVVVLDSCTDSTAATVAAVPGVELLPVRHRNVGAARRAGADLVLRGCLPTTTWLASTDADSAVPPGWLTGMLGHAEAGADLVLGTVVPDSAPLDPLTARWRRGYHAGPGHPHVHGANLGIRGSAYLAAGGWPPAVSGEDVALTGRVAAAGLRVARSGDIPVVTSARTNGRAPEGFAAFLRRLEAGTAPVP